MEIVVTGGNGQLGQSLRDIAKNLSWGEFHFTDVEDFNLLDYGQCFEFCQTHKIDTIINTAAYTAVDKAEKDAKQATSVNVGGTKNLVKLCEETGAKLIHISTDYVFDGQKRVPYIETDKTNPQGVYGKTKLQAEHAITQSCSNYIIIRTSWVYSPYGKNFVKTMLQLAKNRDRLSVVADQYGTPTLAKDLASAIVSLLSSDRQTKNEIYHYSNEGETSWFEFAEKIFELAGLPTTVTPIATKDFPTLAARPPYSVLSKKKITQDYGIIPPDWEDSLTAVLPDIMRDL